jgi:hypothetical protein
VYDELSKLLFSLDFQKEGRYFYREDIEVVIEVPGSALSGSYERVEKMTLDNGKHIYVISIEDIILDRMRAAVSWSSKEDKLWGIKLLASNLERVDKSYLFKNCENEKEIKELREWLEFLQD